MYGLSQVAVKEHTHGGVSQSFKRSYILKLREPQTVSPQIASTSGAEVREDDKVKDTPGTGPLEHRTYGTSAEWWRLR